MPLPTPPPSPPAYLPAGPPADPPPWWSVWGQQQSVFEVLADGTWVVVPQAQFGLAGDDGINLTYALAQTWRVVVAAPGPATSPITVNTPVVLAQPGQQLELNGATLQPGPGLSGAAAVSVNADRCAVRGGTIAGASATLTANPQANGIEILARDAELAGLHFSNLNGWAIELLDQTPLGGLQFNHQAGIHDIWMGSCAGGIHLDGNGGNTVGANLANIFGNAIGGGTAGNLDGLLISDAFDVTGTNVNIGVGNTTTGHGIHLLGHCANIRLDVVNSGGFPNPLGAGQCGIKIEDGPNGHASNVKISGALFQQYDIGGLISGAANDIRFALCDFKGSNTHGLQLSGTGTDIYAHGCTFQQNGAGATGTNYDVNWTGTAHGQLIDCAFMSGIVASGSAGVQESVNTGARNRDQFVVNGRFTGGGAAPANWFTSGSQFPRFARMIGSSPGLTLRQPAVAASGVAVTNDTGMDATVYVTGGTVSAIAVNGSATGLAGTPATVRVPANATITLTYSVAPAWAWFGD